MFESLHLFDLLELATHYVIGICHNDIITFCLSEEERNIEAIEATKFSFHIRFISPYKVI